MLSIDSSSFVSSVNVELDGEIYTLHALDSRDVEMLDRLTKLKGGNFAREVQLMRALVARKIEPRDKFSAWLGELDSRGLATVQVLNALVKELRDISGVDGGEFATTTPDVTIPAASTEVTAGSNSDASTTNADDELAKLIAELEDA